RSEPGPRTEAGQGRGRRHPAAALPQRPYESGRVDQVHRVDACQRADLLATPSRRSPERLLPAGQDLRIDGQALSQQPRDLLRRQGPREEVALRVVAPEALQLRELG